RTGKKPIVYTGPFFFMSTLGGPAGFSSYPVWIANYGVTCPSVPASWSSFTLWQYDDMGAVPGVAGNSIDHDIFNGSLADLTAFTGMPSIGSPAQITSNDAISVAERPDADQALVFVVDSSGRVMGASTTATAQGWSSLSEIQDGA